jgi:hypothetical protein
MTQDARPLTEPETQIEEPSKSMTFRLQPRDQRNLITIRAAEQFDDNTEVVRRALEEYAKRVRRRSGAA